MIDKTQILEASDFDKALNAWVKLVQAKIDKETNAELSNPVTHRVLSIDPKGKKYKRIVVGTEGGKENRSVWAFVDMTSGDVLKASGWKAPAKGVRGSIYDKDLKGMTAHGPVYLR